MKNASPLFSYKEIKGELNMLNDNTIISVKNRDSGVVGYRIPEMNNLRRQFAPGETKKIQMKELRALSWIEGGDVILRELLSILNNKEAVEELIPGAEPEYFMSEPEIKELLLNGSLDELKDFLDFSPEGGVNILRDLAVKYELNDIQKRDAIKTKTGYDITGMIRINKESQEPDAEPAAEAPKRRVQKDAPAAAEPVKTRRTTPKYTV